jgi:hypothetical protein
MIQYLLEKFENIQKQRNLYCANIKNTVKPATEEPVVQSAEPAIPQAVESKILSKKTIFIYDFICENTQGKGPTTK